MTSLLQQLGLPQIEVKPGKTVLNTSSTVFQAQSKLWFGYIQYLTAHLLPAALVVKYCFWVKKLRKIISMGLTGWVISTGWEWEHLLNNRSGNVTNSFYSCLCLLLLWDAIYWAANRLVISQHIHLVLWKWFNIWHFIIS